MALATRTSSPLRCESLMAGIVVRLRWVLYFGALLGVPSFAHAGEQSGVMSGFLVPSSLYVAKYSAPAAEQWARSKGATELEIAAARRCLGADTTRTAKAPARPLALGSYGW